MRDKIKGLIMGILIGVALTASSVIATTGVIQKNLHYNNIKITMNSREITPTDANGNYVEPFIIDGTTYLPVRGVANALGLNVGWDDATKTVKLSGNSAGGMTDAESFVGFFGDTLAEQVEAKGKESGFNYDAKVSAQGNTIIIDLNVAELNNVTDAEKKWLQDFYNSEKNGVKDSMKSIKEMIPSLEKVVYNVRESDGDFLAKFEIEF